MTSPCGPSCLCTRAVQSSETNLSRVVAQLNPGDKVRVSLRGYDRPVVGVLRTSRNSLLATDPTPALFLNDALIRWDGPGHAVRSVEVLNRTTDTREERLAIIDEAADEYLNALAQYESASPSEREHALGRVREAYEACIEAMGAPYEVTEP